jgi:hypothetical protein
MEIWKDIPKYEGYYQVSNLGNINSLNYRRTGKEKLLKLSKESNGYLQVCLFKNKKTKVFRVHQIVLMAFLNHNPCGHKLVINHIDFDKTNNNLNNLEITTQRQNTNQKHLTSTSKYTGVCWDKSHKKWKAKIYINGTNKFLGYFNDELEADAAYKQILNKILN